MGEAMRIRPKLARNAHLHKLRIVRRENVAKAIYEAVGERAWEAAPYAAKTDARWQANAAIDAAAILPVAP